MRRDKAIARLKEILRIDSVEREAKEGKPFGEGVDACLKAALAMMEEEGFAVKNGDGYYGYGEIGEGELFGVLCHLDVVPAGKGWTKDPFGAVEENGRIYARGAMDDKAPFIACLYALTRLSEEGYAPKKRIRVIVGCDEESGWKCMERYVKEEEMPVWGISPDGDFPVINCEKGIVYHDIRYPKPDFIEYLRAGERANMVPDEAEARVRYDERIERAAKAYGCEAERDGDSLVIRAKGKSAHGSHPEEGENALLKVLGAIGEVDGTAREVYDAFSDEGGRGAGLELADETSGRLTLNLGTARTEKGEIVFALDVRHPVSYPKEIVTERLRERLTGRVEETFFHLPLYVEKEHPLVRGLLKAYEKATGEKAEPIAIGGGTYARVLPCGVAFGPCFPNGNNGIHCADEYVDLAEFDRMSAVYYEAFKALCFE